MHNFQMLRYILIQKKKCSFCQLTPLTSNPCAHSLAESPITFSPGCIITYHTSSNDTSKSGGLCHSGCIKTNQNVSFLAPRILLTQWRLLIISRRRGVFLVREMCDDSKCCASGLGATGKCYYHILAVPWLLLCICRTVYPYKCKRYRLESQWNYS